MIMFFSILFALFCILLIFMVVITPSNEGGMAAAFGGMGSDSFFGTKAHQHISKFTVFLAVAFLILAVVINQVNAARFASGQRIKVESKASPAPPPPVKTPPPAK